MTQLYPDSPVKVITNVASGLSPDGSPLFLQAAPQLLILCLDAFCAFFGSGLCGMGVLVVARNS